MDHYSHRLSLLLYLPVILKVNILFSILLALSCKWQGGVETDLVSSQRREQMAVSVPSSVRMEHISSFCLHNLGVYTQLVVLDSGWLHVFFYRNLEYLNYMLVLWQRGRMCSSRALLKFRFEKEVEYQGLAYWDWGRIWKTSGKGKWGMFRMLILFLYFKAVLQPMFPQETCS